MPTGAELFVQTVQQLEIGAIFTLVGDHLNEVLPKAAASGIRIVDMRHESGVTHAADGWARIHRKPALSLVTGGPGHTNSLTGIATANLAGSPLIAVSGSRASSLAHHQAFQDIDQLGMARPVVKWAAEPPDAALIPFYLTRAYAAANTGRKGAVHLTIPVNLFTASVEVTPTAVAPPPEALPGPNPVDIARALDLLRAAERPIAIAGSGVWWSGGGGALQRFIEHVSLPLYTITMGRGVVSDDHPLVMGYADPALNAAARRAFREADLFLIVGKRIDFRLAMGGERLFSPSARFIQIDIHPEELGLNRRLDVAICADARLALETLLRDAGPDAWPRRAWPGRLHTLRVSWQAELAQEAGNAAAPLHPAAFFHELQRTLPPDILYSWDGGDFVHWGRAILTARVAGGWLRLGPLGTIGASLPNSLALQLANPRRRVLAITGDGALGFYLAEMDSLVRHSLPVVLIVGNDAGWGLERELQSFTGNGAATVACELQPARYDLVMKAFGGGGETIERLDQVAPAIQRAFEAGVPYCINVTIRGARSPFTDWQIAGEEPMIRIAIPDDAPPVLPSSASWHEIEGRAELDYYDTLPGSEERLAERISQAEAVLNIRSSSRFTARVMESAPRLRLISVWGTGTDHIDLAAARRRNITVTNTPGVAAFSVAEHALALLLATARRIPQADAAMRRGEWPRGEGVELRGKTCGVIGLGAIGRQFAALAQGIGMRVIAWTMHPQPVSGVEQVELDELFQASDVVSVHLRLSPATEGFIGARQFALMRKNAILINTARGAIVDEAALIEALSAHRISAAGLDVFASEPLAVGHPLTKLPNVVMTPHCAGITPEALEAGLRMAVRNVLMSERGPFESFAVLP